MRNGCFVADKMEGVVDNDDVNMYVEMCVARGFWHFCNDILGQLIYWLAKLLEAQTVPHLGHFQRVSHHVRNKMWVGIDCTYAYMTLLTQNLAPNVSTTWALRTDEWKSTYIVRVFSPLLSPSFASRFSLLRAAVREDDEMSPQDTFLKTAKLMVSRHSSNLESNDLDFCLSWIVKHSRYSTHILTESKVRT